MLKKIAFYFISMLIALISGAIIWSWYNPKADRITTIRVPQVVYITKPEKFAEKYPTVTLPCKEIVALKPSSRDLEALQKKAGGVLPPGEILAVNKIEKLPYGGTGLVTLTPSTQAGEGDKTKLTIIPRQAPFFEWFGERTVSIYGGVATETSNLASLQRAIALEFRQELFRTGPAIWGVKVGTFISPYGDIPYAMFGTSVKF